MNTSAGHILVVDDTPKNIQVLGSMLRESGYAINAAVNGVQALETLKRVTPDLILLDVIMPEMDGFETCRRIKADPRLSEIPIIFLTAQIRPKAIVLGFEVGAVGYITKPFNSSELLKRVDTHLTINRLRLELANKVSDLSSALGDIERLHREQDSFLRHELNNVIGPIAGYTEMLRSQLSSSLNERQKKWMQSIMQGTESMKTMLGKIKKLQDFERGSHKLNLISVPIVGVLTDVVRDIDTQFSTVHMQYDEASFASFRVQADMTFLPGVFNNLIKNAAEHVADLESEAQRSVYIACAKTVGAITVRIQNGGEPIAPERLALFFDKFNTTKVNTGGTGLGTSYARLVARAHGGSVSVSSDSSNGTVVDVVLPLED